MDILEEINSIADFIGVEVEPTTCQLNEINTISSSIRNGIYICYNQALNIYVGKGVVKKRLKRFTEKISNENFDNLRSKDTKGFKSLRDNYAVDINECDVVYFDCYTKVNATAFEGMLIKILMPVANSEVASGEQTVTEPKILQVENPSSNMILRGCFVKHENLDSLYLTKASIVLVFNDDFSYAYGVGTKDQGGGNFGEYHIIGFNDKGSWKFNVGNYKPFDGFYDEMAETASGFPHFNIDDAKRFIEDYEEESMYYYFEMFNRTVDSYELEDALSQNDKDFLGFDEYFCADEDGEYYGSKFVLIEEVSDVVENDSLLWFEKNKIEEKYLKDLSAENLVQQISELIPGNVHFNR